MADCAKFTEARSTRALRFQLLERRDALANALRSRVGAVLAGEVAGAADGETAATALAEAALAVDLAEIDQENAELEAVNAALALMDSGRYGVCGDCGAAIGIQRLEANPAAQHCMACETIREHARTAHRRAAPFNTGPLAG